jgi:hypothetical protein
MQIYGNVTETHCPSDGNMWQTTKRKLSSCHRDKKTLLAKFPEPQLIYKICKGQINLLAAQAQKVSTIQPQTNQSASKVPNQIPISW